MTDSKEPKNRKAQKIGRVWAPVPSKNQRTSSHEDDGATVLHEISSSVPLHLQDDLPTEFQLDEGFEGNPNAQAKVHSYNLDDEDEWPVSSSEEWSASPSLDSDGPTNPHMVIGPHQAAADIAQRTTPPGLQFHPVADTTNEDPFEDDSPTQLNIGSLAPSEEPTDLHAIPAQLPSNAPILSTPTGRMKALKPLTSDPFQYNTSSPLSKRQSQPLESKHVPAQSPQNDQIASASTALYEQLGDKVAPLSKLVLLKGAKAQDQEVLLVESLITMGRDQHNTITVNDPLVSRQQLHIHRGSREYTIEDLQQGNGTILNTKRLTGRATLKDGDTIQIGQTIYQFKRLEQHTSQGNFKYILATFVLVLLIAGGVFFVSQRPSQQYSHLEKETQAHIKQGLQHLQKSKWRKAIFEFRLAQKKSPKSQQVASLLENALKEARVAMLLRKARLLHDKKRWKECLATLQKAEANLATGSIHAEQVWSLALHTKRKLRKRLPKISTLPPTHRPQVVNKPHHPAPIQRPRVRLSAPNKEPVPSDAGVQEEPPPPPPTPLELARYAYHAGALKRAKALFQKANQTHTLTHLKQFTFSFREGRNAHNTRNSSVAIQLLMRALKLDKEIGGGAGVFSKQIKAMLANMYAFEGLQAKVLKQPKTALQNFRKALLYNPKHLLSLQQLAGMQPDKRK